MAMTMDATRAATIAFLTDFGTQDVYVGVMKGVLARMAPQARVIDLTHEIPPGDASRAAFRLWQAAPHFPHSTLFLCVVDPGVGGARRPIALAWPDRICIGPDNGVFTYLQLASEPDTAIELHPERIGVTQWSDTFHGRDLFAPAAARVVQGFPIESLGAPITGIKRLPTPRLEFAPSGRVRGELLFPDRFGNWTTSIGLLTPEGHQIRLRPWIAGFPETLLPRAGMKVILPDGRALGLHRSFSEVQAGKPLAYIGSDGLLEIGVNQGSATEALSLRPGLEIEIGE